MIPVQVGTRIVDLVGLRHAERMMESTNVRAVRVRRTGQIVRLIVTENSLGLGEGNRSEGQNSCRAHKVEQLESSLKVFTLKSSTLFERLPSFGDNPIGRQHVAPTSSMDRRPVAPDKICRS